MRIGLVGPTDLDQLGIALPSDLTDLAIYRFPYIGRLAHLYREHGHQVDIYTNALGLSGPVVVKVDAATTVFVGRRRERGLHRIRDGFALERHDIARLLKEGAPDVAHAHWLYEFALGAAESAVPRLVTAHDSPQVLVGQFSHPYWWGRAALGLVGHARNSTFTAVAPNLAGDLERLRPRRACYLVPNGVRTPDRVAPRKLRGARFVTVANGFDKRKNTASAIAAFSALRASRRDATLTLFGVDHEPGGVADRWARANGMSESITFRGAVSHTDLELALDQDFDIMLHPSRWEACSMAILEAMRAGLPVIGGRHSGGVAYTIGDGRAGVALDNVEPAALTSGMRQMLDGEHYSEASSQALFLAETVFSEEDVVERYLDLLARQA